VTFRALSDNQSSLGENLVVLNKSQGDDVTFRIRIRIRIIVTRRPLQNGSTQIGPAICVTRSVSFAFVS
jgi:hypothetical protein